MALVDKEKIVEEVKRMEREKRDRERGLVNSKRDSSPSSFVQLLKKVESPVVSTEI